jgi:hypothetical protein
MKLAAFMLIGIFLCPGTAAANDGFGELATGGIVIGKTDDIAMASEVLDIGHDLIEVSYDFINEGNHDITDTVIFPLPPYPANPAESGVIYNGQPPDFYVAADGKPIIFTARTRAFIGDTDVSGKLLAAGITEKQMALMPFTNAVAEGHEMQLPHAQIEALNKAGLAKGNTPLWTIQVNYMWQQTFPAGKHVHIYHRYRPFVAVGTASGFDPRSLAIPDKHSWGLNMAAFCPDTGVIKALQNLYAQPEHRDAYGEIPGAIVAYVLKTANSWKNGIHDFTLRLHKQSPSEVTSLCFPAKFSKKDDRTLEARLMDFHPQQDLSIYFGNIDGHFSMPTGLPPILQK